jgi:hypothetical protein
MSRKWTPVFHVDRAFDQGPARVLRLPPYPL